MANFQQATSLEIIEFYAEENGLISSEEDLSERFDSIMLPLVIAQYGEDDTVAIREAFHEYADALQKDGQIHSDQVNVYSYVGKRSADV